MILVEVGVFFGGHHLYNLIPSLSPGTGGLPAGNRQCDSSPGVCASNFHAFGEEVLVRQDVLMLLLIHESQMHPQIMNFQKVYSIYFFC